MRFRRIGDATVAVANGNAVGIAVRQHDDEEDAGEGRAFAARRAIRAIQASGGQGPRLFVRAPRPLGSVERSALLRALVNVIGDEVFGNGRDSVVIDFRPLPPQPKENALDLLKGEPTRLHFEIKLDGSETDLLRAVRLGHDPLRSVTFHRCNVTASEPEPPKRRGPNK